MLTHSMHATKTIYRYVSIKLLRRFNLDNVCGKCKRKDTNNSSKKMSDENFNNDIYYPSTSGFSTFSWNSVMPPNYNAPLVQNNYHIYNFPVASQLASAQRNYCICSQQNLCRCYFHHGRLGENSLTNPPSNNPDETILNFRRWEILSSGKDHKPGFIFTVMSYNVLAQELADKHPYLYYNHDQRAMIWKKRWFNILGEIKRQDPDILCLQEVQESHLKSHFLVLKSLGYKGLYKKRTGGLCDGCAIYYKSDFIDLVEYTSVEYHQPEADILNRDNVALIAKFTPKLYPNKEFVLATTHLLYNPKRQDIRVAQIQVLLAEIDRISYNKKAEKYCSYVPVILTGDFNSSPCTDLYSLLTKGTLQYEYLQWGKNRLAGKTLISPNLKITDNCQHAHLVSKRHEKDLSRTEELGLIELRNSEQMVPKKDLKIHCEGDFCSGTLKHCFKFKSVYEHGVTENKEGTTYQDEWITVDYIFYSGNDKNNSKLKLLSRYRLPTKLELENFTIPNEVLGSDHLSLMAKFKLLF